MAILLRVIFICTILGIVFGLPVDDEPPSEDPVDNDRRIISGTRTKQMSDAPFMASLQRQSDTLKKICGGSILSERWILTAAHCVSRTDFSASDYYVKVGSLDPFDKNNGQLLRVLKIFIHPCYKKGNYESVNDIALLKLTADIKFNQNVQPIFIPRLNHNAEKIGQGKVFGWGAIHRTDHSITSPNLLHAIGHVVSAATCRKAGFHVDERKVCLQKSSQSVCPGDSGGPFVQYDDSPRKDPVVVGIVSESGKVCGEKPVVFTRVTSYIPWIQNVVQNSPEYLPCHESAPSWL